MNLETAQTTTTTKLPILKLESGNSFKPVPQTTTNADGTSTTQILGHVTTEEKVQKKNDVKARSMLLMTLLNVNLMTFNQYKDDQTLFADIQTRFGGFRRLNKPDLDTMSFDDLYNNFKIVEQEVKRTASSSSSSQNMAFVSSPSSTNKVNTAYEVSTANTQVSPASTQVSTASTQDLEQIHKDDIEEMDLKWQLALLRMRTRSSRRTVNIEETSSKAMVAIDGAGFDWSYMVDNEVPSNMALMAFSDSEEFQQPEFKGYGPQTSKSVSVNISNEVKESPDAPLVKELVSDDKLEKKTVFPTVAKIEFVKAKPQEKLVRKPVKPKPVNTARPNLTVVNVVRTNQTSRNLMDDMLPLGEEPKDKKLLVKELLKLLADESQVLLKAPRKNNLYSVDMRNIVPKECLTYLVAKATLDESMLWHRRLGHVNFKTINQLVKENLVRGLPSKRFENDQTCVAFLKGKQHKASCDGPKWLFDIDVLTKLMNYVPVVVGTNSNDLVDGSLFDSSSKNSSNDKPQPSSDAGKKYDEGVNKESRINDQERPEKSTQDINTAGPSINTASTNINIVSPIVTTAPLEATHADFFGDETEVDMSNITTTYPVPSTLNTRVHKDHSLDHVIGDVQSGVQTRRMTKTTNEQGFISAVYEGKTHEDLHTYKYEGLYEFSLHKQH
ncbi:putative ribonuclease H-like domain-containing protein [Tanacetum coccineum]